MHCCPGEKVQNGGLQALTSPCPSILGFLTQAQAGDETGRLVPLADTKIGVQN